MTARGSSPYGDAEQSTSAVVYLCFSISEFVAICCVRIGYILIGGVLLFSDWPNRHTASSIGVPIYHLVGSYFFQLRNENFITDDFKSVPIRLPKKHILEFQTTNPF